MWTVFPSLCLIATLWSAEPSFGNEGSEISFLRRRAIDGTRGRKFFDSEEGPFDPFETSGYYGLYKDHADFSDIRRNVPGEPGIDYPAYTILPQTRFSCEDRPRGYYADEDVGCQVFHVCDRIVVSSFLCPVGSTFSQKLLTCDWWNKVDCASTQKYYPITEKDFSENDDDELIRMAYSMVTYPSAEETPGNHRQGRIINHKTEKLRVNDVNGFSPGDIIDDMIAHGFAQIADPYSGLRTETGERFYPRYQNRDQNLGQLENLDYRDLDSPSDRFYEENQSNGANVFPKSPLIRVHQVSNGGGYFDKSRGGGGFQNSKDRRVEASKNEFQPSYAPTVPTITTTTRRFYSPTVPTTTYRPVTPAYNRFDQIVDGSDHLYTRRKSVQPLPTPPTIFQDRGIRRSRRNESETGINGPGQFAARRGESDRVFQFSDYGRNYGKDGANYYGENEGGGNEDMEIRESVGFVRSREEEKELLGETRKGEAEDPGKFDRRFERQDWRKNSDERTNGKNDRDYVLQGSATTIVQKHDGRSENFESNRFSDGEEISTESAQNSSTEGIFGDFSTTPASIDNDSEFLDNDTLEADPKIDEKSSAEDRNSSTEILDKESALSRDDYEEISEPDKRSTENLGNFGDSKTTDFLTTTESIFESTRFAPFFYHRGSIDQIEEAISEITTPNYNFDPPENNDGDEESWKIAKVLVPPKVDEFLEIQQETLSKFLDEFPTTEGSVYAEEKNTDTTIKETEERSTESGEIAEAVQNFTDREIDVPSRFIFPPYLDEILDEPDPKIAKNTSENLENEFSTEESESSNFTNFEPLSSSTENSIVENFENNFYRPNDSDSKFSVANLLPISPRPESREEVDLNFEIVRKEESVFGTSTVSSLSRPNLVLEPPKSGDKISEDTPKAQDSEIESKVSGRSPVGSEKTELVQEEEDSKEESPDSAGESSENVSLKDGGSSQFSGKSSLPGSFLEIEESIDKSDSPYQVTFAVNQGDDFDPTGDLIRKLIAQHENTDSVGPAKFESFEIIRSENPDIKIQQESIPPPSESFHSSASQSFGTPSPLERDERFPGNSEKSENSKNAENPKNSKNSENPEKFNSPRDDRLPRPFSFREFTPKPEIKSTNLTSPEVVIKPTNARNREKIFESPLVRHLESPVKVSRPSRDQILESLSKTLGEPLYEHETDSFDGISSFELPAQRRAFDFRTGLPVNDSLGENSELSFDERTPPFFPGPNQSENKNADIKAKEKPVEKVIVETEFVPSLGFSFDTEEDRKAFADAVVRGLVSVEGRALQSPFSFHNSPDASRNNSGLQENSKNVDRNAKLDT